MTKKVDNLTINKDARKNAMEYALKEALEKNSKAPLDSDSERLQLAIKNFFDSYESYLENKSF